MKGKKHKQKSANWNIYTLSLVHMGFHAFFQRGANSTLPGADPGFFSAGGTKKYWNPSSQHDWARNVQTVY